jgi:hypothetical protein
MTEPDQDDPIRAMVNVAIGLVIIAVVLAVGILLIGGALYIVGNL